MFFSTGGIWSHQYKTTSGASNFQLTAMHCTYFGIMKRRSLQNGLCTVVMMKPFLKAHEEPNEAFYAYRLQRQQRKVPKLEGASFISNTKVCNVWCCASASDLFETFS